MSGNEKAEFTVKPALEEPRAKVGVPYNAFKNNNNSIFHPLGKIIGMRTSFILSIRSWEIGGPLTSGAGRMKLSRVIPISVIHIIYLEERSSNSLMECSHLDQARKGRKEENVLFNDTLNTFYLWLYGVTHMVKDHSDSKREETRCRHMGYSFRLATKVLLYASSPQQDNTYHGLCYTSRGALAGRRNSSMGPP